MISKDQLRTLRDGDLYSVDGDKIGSIGEIYLDDRTNEPEWVTVNTGLFGTSQSFVPLAGATVTDNGLTVQYSKDKVKDAPRVDGDEHLDVEQERELYRYYEVSGDSAEVTERRSDDVAAGTAAAGTAAAGVADRDRVDADRDDVAAGTAAAGVADRDRVDADRDVADRVDTGDDTMVRHEERLNVGTERVDGGELRLRKYVDTEEQTVTVPVTTESAKVVSRPVDGNTVDNGEAFREEEVNVHLESERPVVSKETVAVEEVGIETERHTENVEVSDSVRKERVEVEGEDVDGTRR